jgi:short-subunit dehydrogenase
VLVTGASRGIGRAIVKELAERHVRQDLDEVYGMIQVNLAGLAHLTHALLSGMQRRGLARSSRRSSRTTRS